MKSITSHVYDPISARRELDAFADLLRDPKRELGERKDISKNFYSWKNILCLLGTLDSQIGIANRICCEFDLFGRLSPDIIIGRAPANRYLFVELEAAKSRSIFAASARKYRKWSANLNKGFNQILAWFWLIEKRKSDPEFFEDFGSNHISKVGLLVIGRDAFINATPTDRDRWDHRRQDSKFG